ncbi:hypothetical protein [Agilicoccus flavus]|uniref:hypothetical protein n=1 Tax=Agilicoccus flavus TaxID=2775968 RepID=UPI001CF60711|nr:hypothetical protein [Agilicoccus flavus]
MTLPRPGSDDGPDYDALFADIVSRFDEPAAGPRDADRPSPGPAPSAGGPDADAGDPDGGPDRDDGAGRRDAGARGAGDQGAGDQDTVDHGAREKEIPGARPETADDPRGSQRPDHPSGPEAAAPSRPPAHGAPPALPTPPVAGGGQAAWRAHTPAEDDEGEFVPPTPAPLPRGDLTFWGALLGLVVGPIWLLYLVVAQPYGSRLTMLLAVLLTVGGFGLLVSRLPRRRASEDDDENGDDGAVV